MFLRLAIALALAAPLVSGCGITTPEDNQIDTVNGTIAVGGGIAFHPFTVKKNGEIFVTVTTLAPQPSASIGMAVGLPASATCSPLNGYVRAVIVGIRAEFGYLNKGDYCWLIYDTGVITTTTSYTANISHP